jgi:hypothetical protein
LLTKIPPDGTYALVGEAYMSGVMNSEEVKQGHLTFDLVIILVRLYRNGNRLLKDC